MTNGDSALLRIRAAQLSMTDPKAPDAEAATSG
jgi:hypothetical protein